MDRLHAARILRRSFDRLSPLLAGLLIASGLLPSTPSSAQIPPPVAEFREELLFDSSSTVAKRLAAVRDYLPEQEWEQAVRIIRQIQDDHGASIAAVAPGRYVSVTQYCQMLLSTLPPQALTLYRAEVDPEARARYAEAVQSRDRGRLVKLLQDRFASGSGDDALHTLAEWSFESGDYASARSYWRQLLPYAEFPAPGTVPQVARYPDSPVDTASLLARLILCTICEGDLIRARRQLEVLETRFPEATGELQGESQNLVAGLQELIQQAGRWPPEAPQPGWSTFAGTPSRNGTASQPLRLQGRLWRQPLPETDDLRRSSPTNDVPLSFHPAVWNDHVYVVGPDRVLAYDLQTGQPAWARDLPQEIAPGRSPRSDRARVTDAATIYPTVIDIPQPIPNRPVTGLPSYTVTINDGRLFARLGSIVTVRSRHEVRRLNSELICLDLKYGQGRLVWRQSAEDLSDNNAALAFEGSPLAVGTAVYCLLRNSFPDAGLLLACFEAEDGQIRWKLPIASILSNGDQSDNSTSHTLLTLAGDLLVVSTDLGAIIAVSRYDGGVRWMTTYSRAEKVMRHDRGDRPQFGLTPCLSHRGSLFCAPGDANGLFALSVANGQTLWKCALPDTIRHLIAAVDDRLIVAGNHLWCLETNTGRILWRIGYDDVEAYGMGRGILVGHSVYWPLREELLQVRISNGEVERRIPLETMYGIGGGNLVCSDGYLLIAGPDELTALGPLPADGSDQPQIPPGNEAREKSLQLTRR